MLHFRAIGGLSLTFAFPPVMDLVICVLIFGETGPTHLIQAQVSCEPRLEVLRCPRQ